MALSAPGDGRGGTAAIARLSHTRREPARQGCPIAPASLKPPREPSFRHELVASFANPSDLLKYEEKTHACAARIPTEHMGKTCGDHAHFRPPSVTECHAFF